MPAVIRSISYPIEYEEKLVELGVDVTKRGTVSQAFRLLIDDAIQRLMAGNPVSVDAMLSDTSVSEKAGNKYENGEKHNTNWCKRKAQEGLIASETNTASLLKAVRKSRKMSILEVSEKSGVNRNTIREIENGNAINKARLNTLCSIAKALKCDLRIELKPYEMFTQEGGSEWQATKYE